MSPKFVISVHLISYKWAEVIKLMERRIKSMSRNMKIIGTGDSREVIHECAWCG